MRQAELFGAVGYRPHVRQLDFHGSTSRFKVLIAGARFGKSLAASRDALVDLVSGPSRGWLVGPSYALCAPEFRYMRDDVIRRLVGDALVEQTPTRLRTSWGAEVWCKSARLPESLLGEEVDWILLCEASQLAQDAFERYLRARLVTRNGRLLIPTTPRGHNWISDIFDKAQSQPDWYAQQAATWDNPHVTKAEIESARASLPADVFAEQFGGEFVTAHGLVYREFEPRHHVVPFMPPPGTEVFRGIDFGYRAPFACLWACEDERGVLRVLREHYRSECALPDHVQELRRIDDSFIAVGCRIGPAFADPSGAGQIAALRAAGMRIVPARNDVTGGIEIVRSRLLMTEAGPGMTIDPACVNLLREINGYTWADARHPRKQADHALDALRYLCLARSRRAGWQDNGPVW